MAKHDWNELKREYILSDCKSVKEFLTSKDISYNGNARKQTQGWADKRVTKKAEKSNKVIEKVIEKQAEKEATQIVNIKDIANQLALKIIESTSELDRHIARNKKKTKTIKYDYKVHKPSEEIIEEIEEITDYISIVDRQGLKQLTSALKDLNDIIKDEDDEDDKTKKIDQYLSKLEEVITND